MNQSVVVVLIDDQVQFNFSIRVTEEQYQLKDTTARKASRYVLCMERLARQAQYLKAGGAKDTTVYVNPVVGQPFFN